MPPERPLIDAEPTRNHANGLSVLPWLACALIVATAGCAAQSSGTGWTPGGYTLPGTLADSAGTNASGNDAASSTDAAAATDSAADAVSVDQVAEIVDDSPDLDGDGYTVNAGDCDDFNTLVHPKAAEICNDLDDNCNGIVDDLDIDGDGFSQCPGAAQDCDDTDPAIHPGAVVGCEPGKDGNCDGLPDMDEDFDFDGFPMCNDCDDKNPNVFPGAAPDCTGKIKDANCDGALDIGADSDKDGFSTCNDCDDTDAAVHLYALESCNGKDDDCNGVVDDLDFDGDGYPSCKIPDFKQDCNDKDLTINPGALRNCKNGKDNDCDGTIDANEDGDGDGAVGCQDCNDYNASISPKALEILGDNIDIDCDGKTDEKGGDCDVVGMSTADAANYAKSIDLCAGVLSASFPVLASPSAHNIISVYGPNNVPKGGNSFIALSSGVAAAPTNTQSGTSFSNSQSPPAMACETQSTVYDYTELKLSLQVPANAQGFAFDFNFMSAEYPEYVGTTFNDKFFAMLDSKKFKGNISFDSKGNCISINNALFNECQGCSLGAAGLTGTGYENGTGGGTGWLTTTAPVAPGETISLRFIIFDEGDHIYDSAVLIDNFRWLSGSTSSTPSTIRPGS